MAAICGSLHISRPSRMSHLVMVTNSLMAKHSSFMLSIKGHGIWAYWWVNFFHPMLQTLAIGLGQKNRPLPHILIFQPSRDEGSSVQTFGSQRCRITLTRRHPVPDFRYVKGCSGFSGQTCKGPPCQEWPSILPTR